MSEFVIPTVSGAIGAISGAFSGWVFFRRKNRAEATGEEIDNAKELVDMYRTLTIEMRTEFENAKQLIKDQATTITHFTEQCVQIKTCRLQ